MNIKSKRSQDMAQLLNGVAIHSACALYIGMTLTIKIII